MLSPFRTFLVVTAALGTSAFACSSAAPPTAATPPFDGDVTVPAGSALTCATSGRQDLSDLRTQIGTDYIEVRQGWRGASPTDVTTQNSVGVACSGATQPAACQKTLASVDPSPGFPLLAQPAIFEVVVVTTTGDKVQTARNANELANVFGGAFDTKEKVAVLLGLSQSFALACNDAKVAAIWPDGDGFQAIAVQNSCDASNRVLVRIAKDGTLTIERSENIWHRTDGAQC